ncbi:MAG: cysteine--tRNA ligase [Pseudomonadota bacterium]|nr:cysteine--tRNA ligase [Pseudomonadota bacterium]
MALTLYNTLERAKQKFTPIDDADVRMYVCGPTVYDYAHIGNARPVVVFDVLYRLLRRQYGADHVKYVRNITDVDDKIITAAGETGDEIDGITNKFAEIFQNDMAALGALPPDLEPRATDHIPEMIALMEKLVADDFAYAAEGHVLFSVASMADYGRLSRHSRDELIAGARVEVAPYKKDAADFVLWKPSTDDQPGWDSPWGRGRPGWHLECSAMSEKHLGPHFDIHGGGLDLIFPHHENEIAQSACAHEDHEFVNYWVHNGYVTVGGEKMSKSEGNFITVHDLLAEGFRGESIRLALLMGHYRQPLDITREKIEEAKGRLDRLYGALRGVADIEPLKSGALFLTVRDSLEDDLNTPKAIADIHNLATKLNMQKKEELKQLFKTQLLEAGKLLGLLQEVPEDWFQGQAEFAGGLDGYQIDTLLEQRMDARKNKDFAESDRIRDGLAKQGIVLEDGPDGTTWRRA